MSEDIDIAALAEILLARADIASLASSVTGPRRYGPAPRLGLVSLVTGKKDLPFVDDLYRDLWTCPAGVSVVDVLAIGPGGSGIAGAGGGSGDVYALRDFSVTPGHVYAVGVGPRQVPYTPASVGTNAYLNYPATDLGGGHVVVCTYLTSAVSMVWYSDDYGASWSASNLSTQQNNVHSFKPTNMGGGHVVIPGYYSDDYGHTWTAMTGSSTDTAGYYVICNLGSGHAVGMSSNGVINYSDDYGHTWTAGTDVGSPLGSIRGGFLNLGGGHALTLNSVPTMWYSDDYGHTWTTTGVTLAMGTNHEDNSDVRTHWVNHGSGHVMVYDANGTRYSSDYGHTWGVGLDFGTISSEQSGFTMGQPSTACCVDNNGVIQYTNDYGQTWYTNGSSLDLYNGTNPGEWMKPCYLDGSTMVVIDYLGNVYRSEDNGYTWAATGASVAGDLSNPGSFYPGQRLTYLGNNVLVICVGGSNSIWVSTDRGTHFYKQNSLAGLPTQPPLVLSNGNFLYSGVSNVLALGIAPSTCDFSLLGYVGTRITGGSASGTTTSIIPGIGALLGGGDGGLALTGTDRAVCAPEFSKYGVTRGGSGLNKEAAMIGEGGSGTGTPGPPGALIYY